MQERPQDGGILKKDVRNSVKKKKDSFLYVVQMGLLYFCIDTVSVFNSWI